jgi:hypothetical protein
MTLETLSDLRIDRTVELMTNLLHKLLTTQAVILVKTYPQSAPISAPTMFYQPTICPLMPQTINVVDADVESRVRAKVIPKNGLLIGLVKFSQA